MARKRKTENEEMSTEVRKILNALKFVSVAQEKSDNYFTSHVEIKDGIATCTNSIVTASVPVPTGLNACPHTEMFMKALEQCGNGQFSLADIDGNEVEISCGNFKASVPAVREMLFSEHGGIGLDIDDDTSTRFHDFVNGCKKFLAKKYNEIHKSSVLLGSNTAIVSDGTILAEVIHPLGELPKEIILPREFINIMRKPIVKSKTITRVEIGGDNFTVYFGENRWISTRLYEYGWPAGIRDKINTMPTPDNCTAISENTREQLSVIADFTRDNRVYFQNGVAFSVATNEKRSSEIETEDIGNGSFDNKAIKTVSPLCDAAYITTEYGYECFNFYCNYPMLRGRIANKIVDDWEPSF
jgi:hypothetical protein